MTFAPKAAPSAWWPRQTPKIGTFAPPEEPSAAKCWISAMEMPASWGGAGAGGDEDVARMQCLDLRRGELVVAADGELRAELPEVLDQVVGEGIIVVEDEDHAATMVLGARG